MSAVYGPSITPRWPAPPWAWTPFILHALTHPGQPKEAFISIYGVVGYPAGSSRVTRWI